MSRPLLPVAALLLALALGCGADPAGLPLPTAGTAEEDATPAATEAAFDLRAVEGYSTACAASVALVRPAAATWSDYAASLETATGGLDLDPPAALRDFHDALDALTGAMVAYAREQDPAARPDLPAMEDALQDRYAALQDAHAALSRDVQTALAGCY